ncbi:hypothetical protein VPNG_09580 [Cytospora leucostoma]|uniref:Ubiquitin-like domain-containing protein n=1 Tax=Cytospora leucostoma TaxID=1230097 RepID=A0A423VN48_9PEZI|nr:hypothetical protein VPNG_09580 [Cytospora leucostoma]
MAAAGFGFSVGDIICGISLVHKLIQALDEAAGSRASYRQLISQLRNLDEALGQVRALQASPTQAARKDTLCHIARQCQLSIETFLNKKAKFKQSLGLQPSVSTWRANLHKLQWALRKDRAIDKLRSEIEAHTTTLNIILTTFHLSTARLQGETLDNCQNKLQAVQLDSRESRLLAQMNQQKLTTQADLLTSLSNFMISIPTATQVDDIQALVKRILETNLREYDTVMQIQQLLSSIPSQVERQQPVLLEDAHGRHFPFHIEFINSFAAFQAVLELRFENVPGLKKVRNLDFNCGMWYRRVTKMNTVEHGKWKLAESRRNSAPLKRTGQPSKQHLVNQDNSDTDEDHEDEVHNFRHVQIVHQKGFANATRSPDLHRIPCNTLILHDIPSGISIDELRVTFRRHPGWIQAFVQPSRNGSVGHLKFCDIPSATQARCKLHGGHFGSIEEFMELYSASELHGIQATDQISEVSYPVKEESAPSSNAFESTGHYDTQDYDGEFEDNTSFGYLSDTDTSAKTKNLDTPPEFDGTYQPSRPMNVLLFDSEIDCRRSLERMTEWPRERIDEFLR